jgi:hypothetical protein
MRPQTLSVVRVISDPAAALNVTTADIVRYATEAATQQAGEAVEEFIAMHGPCIVTPLFMRERPPSDPLMLGTAYEWRRHIMPILDASEEDWADMRRRCNLET